VSTWLNGRKRPSSFSGRDADAGVLDREEQAGDAPGEPGLDGLAAGARHLDRDAAALGELERVADEVRQDLPDPRPRRC
jgi:hypothetical protein